MQIGAVYPQNELRGDPAAVGRIGKAVEDLGFDHLLAYDHVLGAVHADRARQLTGPYTERDPFHDPLVMFAYLAGITERIGFATGVLVLPQRQTALVARQAADVDLLSGGRLRLGVGVGWNYVEYEALGQDFATRGARQEQQIELLRSLFAEPVVHFSGRFDRVDGAAIVPKPARKIPIWIGGSSETAFARAARLADGFIFFGGGADRVVETWDRLRDRVAGVSRSVDDFGGDYVVLPQRSLDDLTAEVGAWRDAGGTHVSVITMGLGLGSVDTHIDYLVSVADALGLSCRRRHGSVGAREMPRAGDAVDHLAEWAQAGRYESGLGIKARAALSNRPPLLQEPSRRRTSSFFGSFGLDPLGMSEGGSSLEPTSQNAADETGQYEAA
jgi:probable F420-dependent oxidoreductase